MKKIYLILFFQSLFINTLQAGDFTSAYNKYEARKAKDEANEAQKAKEAAEKDKRYKEEMEQKQAEWTKYIDEQMALAKIENLSKPKPKQQQEPHEQAPQDTFWRDLGFWKENHEQAPDEQARREQARREQARREQAAQQANERDMYRTF